MFQIIIGIGFYLSHVVSFVASAKILAILPFQIRSHNAIFQTYVNELHVRGHELVVASPFLPQDPHLHNYTFINTYESHMSDSVIISSKHVSRDIYHHFKFMYKWETSHCRRVLDQLNSRKLLHNNDEKPFDLVIMESYYVHCYIPIAVIKNVPLIWYLAPSRMFAAELAIGNDQNPSYFPTVISRTYEFPASERASFLSRLRNFQNYITTYLYNYFHFFPLTESICKEYFGGEISCDVYTLF